MTRRSRLGLSVSMVLLLAAPTASPGAESRTLTGEYYSDKHQDSGALEAEFTPTGEDSWDVVFYASLEEDVHRFEGTARGSLDAGRLEGQVRDDTGFHTFTFRGEFEDGSFRATHATVIDDDESPTGTLVLVLSD